MRMLLTSRTMIQCIRMKLPCSLSTAMPRTRTAVRSASINRSPHALSPSRAAWLAHYPQVVYRKQAHRVHALFFCSRGNGEEGLVVVPNEVWSVLQSK